MIHIDPGERDLVSGEEVANAEGVARRTGPEHAESLKVRRHQQLTPCNKRPQEEFAERRPLAHDAPDITGRDLKDLGVASGHRTDQRRPAGHQTDVAAEGMDLVQGDPLGLAARMLHDLHGAALDDEEIVGTISCLKQVLPIAQRPARAELGQRGDLDVVEGGERNPVYVLVGHVSTSCRGQRTCLTTATTTQHASARPDQFDRRNTRPTVHLVRKRPSPDGSCVRNVSWHGHWANCHNSRHDRRSGRDGDAPRTIQASGILHILECERERA
jgi:hypothetical protein